MKIDDRLTKNGRDGDLVDDMVKRMKDITGSKLYSFVTNIVAIISLVYILYMTHMLIRYFVIIETSMEEVISFSLIIMI